MWKGELMTEMLWMKDPYIKEFEAKVVEVSGEGKFVVLDKTAFYPESGGQLGDEGILTRKSDNSEFKVVFGKKFSDKVSHEVDKAGLNVGDEVKGALDWERRYKMMRMHTAAHVLAAVIYRETKAKISGNQLGFDKSRLDFTLENFDREMIFGLQEKANEIVKKAYPVEIKFFKRDEVQNNEIMRLLMELPPHIKEVRVICIGEIDKSACGGAHVKNTSEIGKMEIIKAENKGTNNRRIYFKLD